MNSSASNNDDGLVATPADAPVPAGVDRRSFFMRSAVIGASAALTGKTWTPQARAEQAALSTAYDNVYFNRVSIAHHDLLAGHQREALRQLDAARPEPGEPDRRGWEWPYLDRWCSPELRTLRLPTAFDSHAIAVSPDGRWVVFSVLNPAYDEKEQSSDLWLVPADGSAKPRRITFTKAAESGVSWSPDSKQIAVVSLGDEIDLSSK